MTLPFDGLTSHGLLAVPGGFLVATSSPSAAVIVRVDEFGVPTMFGDAGFVELIGAGLTRTVGNGVLRVGAGYVTAGQGLSIQWNAWATAFDDTGSVISSFGENGDFETGGMGDEFVTLSEDDGERFYVYGSSYTASGFDCFVVRVLANGRIDPTFADGQFVRIDAGGNRDACNGVITLADGGILGVGVRGSDALGRPALYRLASDGIADASFGIDGVLVEDAWPGSYTSVARWDDIVVVSGFDDVDGSALLRRLDAAGRPSHAPNSVDFGPRADRWSALLPDGPRLYAYGLRENESGNSMVLGRYLRCD